MLPKPPPLRNPPARPYGVTKEKLFLQDKIRALTTSFHHKLGGICGETEDARQRWLDGINELSEAHLKSLLDSIKYKIGQAGLSDMVFVVFGSVTMAIEHSGPYVGLRLDGYSAALTQNPQAREALLEIMCDRMSSVVLSPEKRLLMILLSTAYSVHSMNQVNAQPVPTGSVDEMLNQPAL